MLNILKTLCSVKVQNKYTHENTHKKISMTFYPVFYYWLFPLLLLSNLLVVTTFISVRGYLSNLFVIFIVRILLLFQHELRKRSRAMLS